MANIIPTCYTVGMSKASYGKLMTDKCPFLQVKVTEILEEKGISAEYQGKNTVMKL